MTTTTRNHNTATTKTPTAPTPSKIIAATNNTIPTTTPNLAESEAQKTLTIEECVDKLIASKNKKLMSSILEKACDKLKAKGNPSPRDIPVSDSFTNGLKDKLNPISISFDQLNQLKLFNVYESLKHFFCVDIFGNVICIQSENGSPTSCDRDHLLPHALGGSSILENMNFVSSKVNRNYKKDKHPSLLDPNMLRAYPVENFAADLRKYGPAYVIGKPFEQFKNESAKHFKNLQKWFVANMDQSWLEEKNINIQQNQFEASTPDKHICHHLPPHTLNEAQTPNALHFTPSTPELKPIGDQNEFSVATTPLNTPTKAASANIDHSNHNNNDFLPQTKREDTETIKLVFF